MPQPTVVKDPHNGAGPKQTEDMPALFAKEMRPTAFHLFPNLAPELRLKIWKAACFPYAANHRGLHYINLKHVDEISGDAAIGMNSMEMKALHPDF
ncbi:tetracycline resistance [Fusarium mexicanum]|uniref:Tetracycline resistance n=1 Tax=Fusarium mexicanum TaxID=751941 RepID=A0A8H5N9C1_9HYPO|nr:tetracycline resistance [Fusarium mexicanum]